ncbi:MAG: hypothetical protein JSS75_13760 [Bacteroidetes bacterium]|nr:hypothetical protein [Bacteroidota bacterium]
MRLRPYIIAVIVICAGWVSATAQPFLRPTIGILSAPHDDDAICTPGPYSTDFNSTGLHAGDQAFDFTLYDENGDSTTLGTILALGKPVLLVAGSYTCPVFRYNVATINDIVKRYGDHVSTYIIYTVEAHPVVDKSPYGDGDAYSDELNVMEGIQFTQPKTYGQRKAMLRTMQEKLTINAPILLDAPCNQYLEAFGPAPNNAYLIDQNGMVRYKEPWFNLNGSNVYSDLDELLNIDTTQAQADTGRIHVELVTNDTIYATPGSTVSAEARLINETDVPALIRIDRHNGSKMPGDWKSALCTNVCLSPNVDTTVLRVEAHSEEHLRIYVYMGDSVGTGRVFVHLHNEYVPEDTFKIRLVYIATDQAGVRPTTETSLSAPVLMPNPATSAWSINTTAPYASIRLYDVLGRVVAQYPASDRYSCASLPYGTYRVELLDTEGKHIGTSTLVRE